jgi:NCS1 family nucleobase:cation symporter-1
MPELYTNEDLAPTPPEGKTWGVWNFAALWISMSLCIPTYMLASSLIDGGMNWWQSLVTICLGNLIVLVPMVLNGRPGVDYGIPFPVLARASFGLRGANIPAFLRAIVACGWFGIQAWIGGFAFYQIVRVWIPSFAELPDIFPDSWDLKTGPAITFIIFWIGNMVVVYFGVDSIRKLLVFKAFFLPVAALALFVWALVSAGGFGAILKQPSKFETTSEFLSFFFPALTGMVGFWAALSLNIPDFTRYASSQRAQMIGQAVSLPTSMTIFSFIGIVVTSATPIIFGVTVWDPVVLGGMFESKILVTIAMISIIISTLATNIAANIVSPANDFANLYPAKIDFKIGGYITGVIGVCMFPWKLIEDPNGYIFKWLVAYSSLLGAIGGIMIVDYYLIRKQVLHLDELYTPHSGYWYTHGFHVRACVALILGIIPNFPGFLTTIEAIPKDSVPHWLSELYHYSWFIAFFISGAAYYIFWIVGGDLHKAQDRVLPEFELEKIPLMQEDSVSLVKSGDIITVK